MTTIQIVSDLHLERSVDAHETFTILPRAPHLALLNRTCYDNPGTNVTVLSCTHFSHVPQPRMRTVSRALHGLRSIESDWCIEAHVAGHARDLA